MIRNLNALITRKDIIKRKTIIYRHNILKSTGRLWYKLLHYYLKTIGTRTLKLINNFLMLCVITKTHVFKRCRCVFNSLFSVKPKYLYKKNSRFDPFNAKYISLINKVTETEHIFLYFIAGVFVVSFIDMHCLSNKLNISKGKFLGMLITDYASQTCNILDKICVST